ncbi:acyl-CoA synthetase [Bacterioplanoides sp.]|uniref:acyl-CoA synthetase n=1 Tax=Bacterioplanoides sp. TaxID=2066072 RepID=UPI003B00B1BA
MNNNLESLSAVQETELAPYSSLALPDSTYGALKASAERYGNNAAIEFFLSTDMMDDFVSISYKELFANITRCANMFRAHGIDQNNMVGLILPNLPETHYAIWGGEAAGTALSLNPLLEVEQLSSLLKTAGVRWLVTLGPTPGSDIWEKSLQACEGVDTLEGIFQINLSPYLGGLKSAFIAGSSAVSRLKSSLKVKSFNAELKKYNGERLDFAEPKADDIASCFCTGGTTGLPKIARRPHSSEVYDAWAVGRMVASNLTEGVGVFCGLPLFHVNGQIVTGLASWMRGAKVILGTPQGYRGEGVVPRFWEIVERFKVAAFSGVPTLYAGLLNYPTEGHDISSLQAAFCGAAPMPKELFRQFQDRTGIPIIEGYGLTEGTCASSLNPGLSEKTIGSIGIRLPYQDMMCIVLDDDGNYVRDAEVNEVGAVSIKGPNVFAGYMEESHNKGIWIERNGETWLNTGDLGRQDADGYFWLTGRKKELIIRGGHNIDPKTIEEAMHEHPKVRLAAAIGRPDAYAGELPVVYVELEDNVKCSEDELMAFAQENIAEKAAWPKSIQVLDAMPVTPVGKIFKPALQMMEIEFVIRREAQEKGAEIQSLEVSQHAQRGLLAEVKLAQSSSELLHALDQYAFEYDIV